MNAITGFRLTVKQQRQIELMGSDATHIMSYGGSRSGKTFGIVRAVLVRALAHKSRHAILRYRFNHVKQSIIMDTLPKVMELCFPEVAKVSRLDKTDWVYYLPNGSEIWFGGLDDKERTEKILGLEFATIYLNECSQIPWASRNMAMTRLAQKTPLRLKAYYDCNPPGMAHWTYRVFVEKRDPDRRQGVPNPGAYTSILMNPVDNKENLAPDYIAELEAMSEPMRRRFLLGMFADVSDSQLWSLELLDQQRILDGTIPDMARIVVGVDPSGASGEEDVRSDEIGIIVAGLGVDGRGYVLEDISARLAPEAWALAAVAAFDRWDADAVIAEKNFGGDMVAAMIRGAAASPERPATDRMRPASVPVTVVNASRSKAVRAEPIAALFSQQRVSLVGLFPELEDQLVGFTTSGYTGGKSPDRADAMVWALSALFPALTRPRDNALGTLGGGPKVNLGYANLKRRRSRGR